MLRYRVCDECDSEDGVRTNKININGHKYEIDTCRKCADELEDDMRRWTDIGTKTGEPSIFDTPRESVRLVLDAGPSFHTPAVESAISREQRVEELPATAQRWTLTDHAKERMEERGFNLRDILWAAERPETVLPNKNRPGTFSHARGGCVVIVSPDTLSVLTVKYSDQHPMSDNFKKVGTSSGRQD